MFGKVLIADRGEIALRILRACRELGIKTVIAHSEADREAGYVALADESVCIGPAPAQHSYLNIQAILSAAELTEAQAIHPGYGPLASSVELAERSEACGFVFIGPRAETLRLIRNKVAVREAVKSVKIPLAKGSPGALPIDSKEILRIARETGYPVIIKPTHGSAGRGLRVVHSESALLNAVTLARNEATTLFGTSTVYLEKRLENPRLIKFQVLADAFKNAIYLGEHECSIQHQGQRIIEESPAPGITPRLLARLGERCAELCRRITIRGLVSFEFLYENGEFFFLDLNTHLQVEHPLIEAISGIDLVQEQLRIAAGHKLRFRSRDLSFRGHAIESRIYAQSPNTAPPLPATITRYHAPGGPGIRVDSHIDSGYTLPPYYDSLIAKVIACGENREHAIQRMRMALAEMNIDGIKTNLPLHQDMLNDAAFVNGEMHIHSLDNLLAAKAHVDNAR
ncbi:MAG: biotin carboxylase N-terminal domain-containing protein [Betaproteobacteria bacterium]